MLQQIFNLGCSGTTIDSISETNVPKPNIYFIGIKGSGMCALAQLLKHLGYEITGSDVAEQFYTDELLRSSSIAWHCGFAASNLTDWLAALGSRAAIVVYSAAYGMDNPEYKVALQCQQQKQLLVFSYPQALGHIARCYKECLAIAGTHGKTTSTLLCSSMMQSLSSSFNLAASAIAGAAAPHLQGNSFLSQGSDIFAVEACEYRNHFFEFDPHIILLTSLEWDHQDFFTSYEMLENSFYQFISKDSVEVVIYCADDPNIHKLRTKLHSISKETKSKQYLVPYGFSATGEFIVESIESQKGETILHLKGLSEWPLRLLLPGEHLALNALGALVALFHTGIIQQQYQCFSDFLRNEYQHIQAALANFCGASRRSELLGLLSLKGIGKTGDILVLDDYAHHPTAVRKTLVGLKKFYPDHRLVLDFMPHTYSRSIGLHKDFSHCFEWADVLILHDIYGCAREDQNPSKKHYNGRMLWQAVNKLRPSAQQAYYFAQPLDALPALQNILQSGDLFVTMGAGNNRELALALRTLLEKDN